MRNAGFTLTKEHKRKLSFAHKDKKFTEEHKQNIRKALLGKTRPPFSKEWKRRIGDASRDRKMSDETKRKQSDAHKGKNHYRWKVDRNLLKKSDKKHLDSRYCEWMLVVKKRDGWKCKIADKNCKGKMEAHHMLRWTKFPELRYEVNNGITLCHFHHPRKIKDEMKLSPFFQELVISK